MNVFNYDSLNKQLEINEPEIFLVREFKALLERDKERAFKELTYIFLALDYKSIYSQYTEYERHEEALSDSGITEEMFNDPLFREACRKYRSLQDSNKSIKLLNAARNAADQFVDYFETIIDLNERDQNGKPEISENFLRMVRRVRFDNTSYVSTYIKLRHLSSSQLSATYGAIISRVGTFGSYLLYQLSSFLYVFLKFFFFYLINYLLNLIR